MGQLTLQQLQPLVSPFGAAGEAGSGRNQAGRPDSPEKGWQLQNRAVNVIHIVCYFKATMQDDFFYSEVLSVMQEASMCKSVGLLALRKKKSI